MADSAWVADWIASYAAIVATGALALEIRRWFEGRLRLYLRASPDMQIIGAGPGGDDTDLVVVSVYNRGEVPTTITNFGLLRFDSWLARLRLRSSWSAIVPNPQARGAPAIIPFELEPGRQWMGMVQQRSDLADFASGEYWAAIYTTGRNRPYLAPIRRRGSPKAKT